MSDRPRIHTLTSRDAFAAGPGPLVSCVKLAFAVSISWDPPDGTGDWLVVERGYARYRDLRGTWMVTISDGGVVRHRATTAHAARTKADRAARHARSRGCGDFVYEVANSSTVRAVESGQPYGCISGSI